MNVLDWILVVIVAAYALSGYWQGFITGFFATAGLLLGGLLGIWLAPIALGNAESSIWVSLGALFIVILSATLGQALMQFLGSRLRDRITWQPVRAVDAVGGAALSAAAVLIVAWALGLAISGSRISGITPEVRASKVLRTVNDVLPDRAASLLTAFNNVVGTSFFPQYLEPFARETIVGVDPPDAAILRDPQVQEASNSVLKIHGDNACGRGVEGTGFLYADDRLMTNAHVVAGVDSPTVLIGDERITAKVVYYNPDLDVAVLEVNDQGLPAMEFGAGAEAGDAVAVLGYPQDGPYNQQPARVRSEQRLRSPNIYGDGTVVREVLSVRGLIRPGNSGGPLVDADGNVAGVVFAASVTDADTGYALTGEAVAKAAATGLTATKPVSTGDCAS